MIRRELPLTVIASPAESVAYGKRGFSFVLALAAAGSVLEIGGDIHWSNGSSVSYLGRFLLLFFLSSCRDTLPGDHFSPCAYGPDEAQQFTGNCVTIFL